MVPVQPLSDASSTRDIDLPDIIFSCGVCQKTASEIYATTEGNKGFHSDSGDEDGAVTRLWIAECSHLMCGKHLPGGGAPFYPQGEQPRAACPLCVRDKGDDTPKALFGIRGTAAGQHDPAVPDTWFHCPPIRLDGATPGMDAVRFQYMALARFAQKVQRRWKDAEQANVASEQKLSKERKQRKDAQYQLKNALASASQTIEALRVAEAQLMKWRERQPYINHYLGLVTTLSDDLTQMRSQLARLGYSVPHRDYSFKEPRLANGQKVAAEQARQSNARNGQRFSSSSTAADRMVQSSSSQQKRKRQDYEADLRQESQQAAASQHRASSRDMMPPPSSRPVRMPAKAQSQRPMVRSVDAIQELNPARSATPNSRFTQLEEPGGIAEAEHASYRPLHCDNEPRRLGEVSMPLQRNGVSGYADEGAGYYDENPRGVTSRRALEPEPHNNVHVDSFRITQYDSAYGTVQDQRETQSRAPLQLYPDAQDSDSFSMRDKTRHPMQQRGLSPRNDGRRPLGSVISSFFNRAKPNMPPDATAIPSTRGSMMSGISNFYGASNTAYARPESRAGRPLVVETAAQQAQPSPFVRPAPPSRFQQPDRYAPPSRSFELEYRQSIAVPPSPRLQPPAAGPASYQPSVDGPTVGGAFRNRITLPPSTARTHDYELSSVPGLRGSRNNGAYTQRGTGYTDSKPLFSAAGRRSVRR